MTGQSANSTLSPAIHLGATRILAVGVSSNTPNNPAKTVAPARPSLSQILGHILNSACADTLASDLEALRRTNTLVNLLPPAVALDLALHLRPIELLDISPSHNLNNIAREHFEDLPRALKLFGRDTGSSAILSLLLFENVYSQRLMDLGDRDALAKEAQRLAFFRLC